MGSTVGIIHLNTLFVHQGVDWDDCTVQEYIDFMRKGIIPQYYEKDYKEWLSSQKED